LNDTKSYKFGDLRPGMVLSCRRNKSVYLYQIDQVSPLDVSQNVEYRWKKIDSKSMMDWRKAQSIGASWVVFANKARELEPEEIEQQRIPSLETHAPKKNPLGQATCYRYAVFKIEFRTRELDIYVNQLGQDDRLAKNLSRISNELKMALAIIKEEVALGFSDDELPKLSFDE
jgi:hypothetical protein